MKKGRPYVHLPSAFWSSTVNWIPKRRVIWAFSKHLRRHFLETTFQWKSRCNPSEKRLLCFLLSYLTWKTFFVSNCKNLILRKMLLVIIIVFIIIIFSFPPVALLCIKCLNFFCWILVLQEYHYYEVDIEMNNECAVSNKHASIYNLQQEKERVPYAWSCNMDKGPD